MKALSVRQPWAGLIASGRKSIETRVWKTDHRGRLLICSGVHAAPASHPFVAALGLPPPPRESRGIAVCVVDLVDCRPMTDADAPAACCPRYDRAWTWLLANPRPVKPFPVRGALKLFDVDDRLIRYRPSALAA